MTADRITVGPAAERDFAKWASETIAKQASEIAALRRRVAQMERSLQDFFDCSPAVSTFYHSDGGSTRFPRLETAFANLKSVWQSLSPSPPAEERESGT
jgi:hypothetical protein